MEVDLDGPRAGEVLVEIMATGICHTDAFTLSGADPEGMFPAILGHEGAGVVREVGPGVTSLEPGDHVIPLYTPECRECEYCLHPKTNLCQSIRTTQGQGVMPDGTSRFSLNGKPILHYMGTSTFANFTVLPEISLAKVNKAAPFEGAQPAWQHPTTAAPTSSCYLVARHRLRPTMPQAMATQQFPMMESDLAPTQAGPEQPVQCKTL